MSNRTSILLAEDEAMLRFIVAEMLVDAGFQVFEAADGIEALEVLRTNTQITLLVSDIKMPPMDGYALVEAGLALKPDLKVILMTGYAQDPPRQILKACPMQILHKPFNVERLCAIAMEMTA